MKLVRTLSALFLIGLFASAWGQDVPAPVDEGSTAPDWILPSSDGNTYSLSELLKEGPVVLAWFPRAFTRGCTIECKSLAENGDMIRAFKASYFMASVDPIEDNVGFAEENDADFPILSDESKAIARRYGVLSERGFANRQTFYIDSDGIILSVDRNVNPSTAAEDIAATLERLGVERVGS